MPKATVEETYIYEGEIFGPGEVEIGQDAYDALKARGVIKTPRKSRSAEREEPDGEETE